jgi:hypothetical protein
MVCCVFLFALQAEWEENMRLAAAARVLARERLVAASQWAKEEASLAADIARLRGQALARAVANRSKARIRHNVAPRESLFDDSPSKLGRGYEHCDPPPCWSLMVLGRGNGLSFGRSLLTGWLYLLQGSSAKRRAGAGG